MHRKTELHLSLIIVYITEKLPVRVELFLFTIVNNVLGTLKRECLPCKAQFVMCLFDRICSVSCSVKVTKRDGPCVTAALSLLLVAFGAKNSNGL